MSCLDENMIAAFAGAVAPLADNEIARIESHVRECDRCRGLLSFALSAATPTAATSRFDDADMRDRTEDTAGTEGLLARGSEFGRYTVLGLIGRGAMSEVYGAYDPGLDRKVALKILHGRGGGADQRSGGRLLREAKAIAKLRHPNVVLVHEAGAVAERVFLAMEYVEGQTLASWLGERNHTRAEIIDIFVEAGHGLGAAHAAGLVHRDFKPQNVMVAADGAVRVTDFGLAREIASGDGVPDEAELEAESTARRAGSELPLTRTGELVGTPLYMAPEQFARQRTDARTDQFSFCVALYQALYEVHPFKGGTLGELMAAVTAGRIEPAPSKTTIPQWLRRTLLRGLSVDPAQRWPSMEALGAALSRDPVRQRRRWLGGVAIGTAMVAALVVARKPTGAHSICRQGPHRLIGVWEPEGEAGAAATRRAATQAAFLKTGSDHAGDAWRRAAAILDRYTEGWLHMYQEACAATHERGEQSVKILDLRMACLDERLERVKALTDVFADANANVVDNAVSASGALPSLDRCADVTQLRAVVPPPDNPDARARVEALRHQEARIVALHDSGQCAAASKLRHDVVHDADQLGYLPLQAEVLLSFARTECVDSKERLRNCRRAAFAAAASRDDEAFTEAVICVAVEQADLTPEIGRARDWIDLATALMQRASTRHATLESWRLMALSRVYQKEGEQEHALETLEQARALVEKTHGTEHLDYARVLTTIGVELADGGRLEEAAAYHQRAAQLALKIEGPNSSVGNLCLANAAEVLNGLGRYAEAQAAAEQAVGIQRRVGSSALLKGYALTTLGQALLGQDRPRQAAVELDEALGLLRDDPSVYSPTVRFMLARALWSAPESRPRAVALAREAKIGYQRFSDRASDVAAVEGWLREHAGVRTR